LPLSGFAEEAALLAALAGRIYDDAPQQNAFPLGRPVTTTAIDQEFERLVREFFMDHPEIVHEWRDVKELFGSRRDIICEAGTPREVFASLNRGGQIAVGITRTGNHGDFEDFGRKVSDSEIATEAFNFFIECLRETGQLVQKR
jgi:hypothetical protein